jgi:hypothetical protein
MPMRKSRAQRDAGRAKDPTKRAKRGAQQVARRDMQRGVSSRARKRIEGHETTPDPRYGGRPGQRMSKWRPPPKKT